MNFPISIGRTSLFQILGMLGGIFFSFKFKSRTFCEQTVETDLVPLCLPMSHKKDPRLMGLHVHLT